MHSFDPTGMSHTAVCDPTALTLPVGTSQMSLVLPSLQLLIRHLKSAVRSALASFCRLNNTTSVGFSLQAMCFRPSSSWWIFRSCSNVSVPCSADPQAVCPSGINIFFRLLRGSLCCQKATFLTHTQVIQQDPPSYFVQSCFLCT